MFVGYLKLVHHLLLKVVGYRKFSTIINFEFFIIEKMICFSKYFNLEIKVIFIRFLDIL